MRSIRRKDGTRVGAIVVTKYAAPAMSRAGERPSPATASPPSTPPSGISDQQMAVLSDETRPSSGAGIRSRMTAPRIGLRKPDATPATKVTAKTAHSGDSSAITTKRGAPQIRNAMTYVR